MFFFKKEEEPINLNATHILKDLSLEQLIDKLFPKWQNGSNHIINQCDALFLANNGTNVSNPDIIRQIYKHYANFLLAVITSDNCNLDNKQYYIEYLQDYLLVELDKPFLSLSKRIGLKVVTVSNVLIALTLITLAALAIWNLEFAPIYLFLAAVIALLLVPTITHIFSGIKKSLSSPHHDDHIIDYTKNTKAKTIIGNYITYLDEKITLHTLLEGAGVENITISKISKPFFPVFKPKNEQEIQLSQNQS